MLLFLSGVSINFLILVLAVVFFIVSFSKVYCLEFVSSSVPWLLDSILFAFSELLSRREETFCNLNVFFS